MCTSCKDLKTNITWASNSLSTVCSWSKACVLVEPNSERWSGTKTSFHSHKDQTTNFWLFSILHPELKHIAEKTTFASLHFCQSPLKVSGIGRHFRRVILRGAVLLPRQNLQAAPQAAGCSWHLPLECRTAFFYTNTQKVINYHTNKSTSVTAKAFSHDGWGPEPPPTTWLVGKNIF